MTTETQPDTRIYINKQWQSGDPCIYGTRVPVWCVSSLFAYGVGASVAKIAGEYGITEAQALEALRWQLRYYAASKKERRIMRVKAIAVGREWEQECDARKKTMMPKVCPRATGGRTW
jgi:uncharacterized protein (DUF433 family)